jgi:hypothetical protein
MDVIRAILSWGRERRLLATILALPWILSPLLSAPAAAEAVELASAEEVELLLEEMGVAAEAGYNPPLTIPHAQFFPPRTDQNLQLVPQSEYVWCNSGTCCAGAAVYLPDGVTVTGMVSWLYDNDPTKDFSLSLRRKRNGNLTVAGNMATTPISGDQNSVRPILTFSIANPVIDNGSYFYFLATDPCLQSTQHAIFQVLIYYSYAE